MIGIGMPMSQSNTERIGLTLILLPGRQCFGRRESSVDVMKPDRYGTLVSSPRNSRAALMPAVRLRFARAADAIIHAAAFKAPSQA